MVTGEVSDEIDHEDGDTENNRWGNLRDTSHSTNLKNQKRRSTNSTGFIGVSPRQKYGDFQAHLRIDGHNTYLGIFPTAYEAHLAYEEAKVKHGYHRNHGRA